MLFGCWSNEVVIHPLEIQLEILVLLSTMLRYHKPSRGWDFIPATEYLIFIEPGKLSNKDVHLNQPSGSQNGLLGLVWHHIELEERPWSVPASSELQCRRHSSLWGRCSSPTVCQTCWRQRFIPTEDPICAVWLNFDFCSDSVSAPWAFLWQEKFFTIFRKKAKKKSSCVLGEAAAFSTSAHPHCALPGMHRASFCIITLVFNHGNIFRSSDTRLSDPALCHPAGKATTSVQRHWWRAQRCLHARNGCSAWGDHGKGGSHPNWLPK